MSDDQQMTLGGQDPPARPDRLGHADVTYRKAGNILTRASGFMDAYDFTLNPYSGCGFGCTYCYAAFFSRDRERQDSWGQWVEVKENAVEKLRAMRTPLRGKSIYMSSVTDPYQPIERKLGLVRELLEALVPEQPRLVVQTRSPLVTRDIDLLSRLDAVRVNMTVTTDDEEVRKIFEPHCPANRKRLEAIETIARAGIDTSITMTPLLPLRDPASFANQLAATSVRRFVVQPFHADKGRFVAGTQAAATEKAAEMNWDSERYSQAVSVLRQRLPNLAEGRDGFAPV